MYTSRKNPYHVNLMEGHWKFLGGGGLEESMKQNWNFLGEGGGGLKAKPFCGRSMDILWNSTIAKYAS